MCYRTSQRAALEEMKTRFQVTVENPEKFVPFFHKSAFTHPEMPIITSSRPDALQFFSWGLVPSWIKSQEQLNNFLPDTMNARGEGIFETRSYKEAASRGQRCLIPVTGFFEPHTYLDEKGKEKKMPFYIQLKSAAIFSFAGLWSSWCDQATGEIHFTYTMLTCEANPLMAKVHNTKKRMPLILDPAQEKLWLSPDLSPTDVLGFIKPYPQDDMDAYPVSNSLHNPRIDMNIPEALVRNNAFILE